MMSKGAQMTKDQRLLKSLKRDRDGFAAAADQMGLPKQSRPWLIATLDRAIADLERRIAAGERNIRPEDLGA